MMQATMTHDARSRYQPTSGAANGLSGSVLIIGFGRFGQVMSQSLLARQVDVAIIDTDIEMIDVAEQFGAKAVFPSDKPYLPFQQWAIRAEGLQPSPLGILMHPEYGLWHAYRGALLFDVELPFAPPHNPIHLCDACVGKPCLKACPVGAHSAAGFAHGDCLTHVRSPAGEPCRTAGCFDRNACPYGTAYRYPADQQAFHMAAFAG